MREIKFRAWDKVNGGWIDLDEWPIGDMEYESIDFMQFTGLKDKNGKDVYEGDICLVNGVSCYDMADPNPSMRIIKWDDKTGSLTHFRIDGEVGGTGFSYCRGNLEKFYEVIGNIYENGDLLEQKDAN